MIEADGRVLRVDHDRVTVEGLVLDGRYGDDDALEVRGDDFTLRDAEVRRAGQDCVDIGGAVSRARVERATIHHCLRSSAAGCDAGGCRDDAHGIVADEVQGLEVVDTRIHTFSGDAIQLNGRDQPTMWQDVVIRGCVFELAPLAVAEGGFAAGVVPGENAIDTKTPDDITTPARMTIVDTVARGYRGGLITNMAAYNLKENVAVQLDRVTVHDSEIAFRVRGATSSRPRGAQVTVHNAVIFDVDTAVRYEDDLGPLVLRHITLGDGVGRMFQRAGAPMGAVDATNLLVLGALPAELMAGDNRSASAADFVDAPGGDLHLQPSSAAVDAATTLTEVAVDRDGVGRPQGAASDYGAYERCDGCAPIDAGPLDRDAGPAVPGVDAGPPAPGTDAGRLPPGVDGGPGGGSDGCGCRTAGRGGAPWAAWLLVPLALARRRLSRRPRARTSRRSRPSRG